MVRSLGEDYFMGKVAWSPKYIQIVTYSRILKKIHYIVIVKLKILSCEQHSNFLQIRLRPE